MVVTDGVETIIQSVESTEDIVIEGLNVKEGIQNSGTKELVFSLLGDFYKLIDQKSTKAEKCLADGMIRSEAEFSDIPVMFLTSKNDKESIKQVLGLKPEGYILKTTSPEQIVQMIEEHFQKQKTL